MNKICHIIIAAFFLVSCNRSTQHAVLVQIDSLMTRNLDSAYTSLRMIDPKQLSMEDEAYYSLLQTTAQYKKCLPIRNDSIINIAVDYYSEYFDQDKLTKALIYKGGVLADLNYNRTALKCYKEAEKVIDTTDYLTMGLLNTRFGKMYQKSYIKNDEHIKRYKKALMYYRKTNHQTFQNSTLHDIGQLYILIDFDSSAYYLNQAINLSIKSGNKLGYLDGCATLARLYNHYNIKISEAKDLFLYVHNYKDSVKTCSYIISNIVSLYNKLGKVDSAAYYSKQFPPTVEAIDSMRYFMMHEEIALTNKDYKTAYYNYKKSEEIADSIVKNSKSEQYYYIDKEFDNQLMETKNAELKTSNHIKMFILSFVTLLLVIVMLLWMFYSKRKKTTLLKKEQFIDTLQITLQGILYNLNQGKETELVLKNIIESRISITKQLLNIKYLYGTKPDIFFSKFDEVISLNKKNQSDCNDIINIVNHLYSDIITNIEQLHPELGYKEKLLLSLICLKFSTIEMLVFLNLKSTNAVYILRCRLMKTLGTNSLEEYTNEQIRKLSLGN